MLTHKFTSEQKLEWWGYGEWVEEPDLMEFTYNGLDCKIVRVVAQEINGSMFGGHFCGYVKLPENSPFIGKEMGEIDIECHWGITFSHDGWIGFDCAHSGDYTPSIQHLYKTNPEMIAIRKKHQAIMRNGRSLFETTYRNIQFCVDECKKMVDQLVGADANT